MLKKIFFSAALPLVIFSVFFTVTFNFVSAEDDVLGIMNDNPSSEMKEIESKGIVPCTIETCTFCSLLKMLERINIFLLGIAFTVAIFFIVTSGFAYIVSIGDSGTMGFAKEGLKYAIGGFIICLFSFLAIHAVYSVTGYKNPNGGNWWEIECNSEAPQSLLEQDGKKKIAKTFANEVQPSSVGGRENPISLDELVEKNLASLPEGKYFFLHGLGGQSLNETADQLLRLTQKAVSSGKDLTVALPRQDLNGNVVGQKNINIASFLESLKAPIETGGNKSKMEGVSPAIEKDKFFELALSILDESSSVEVPLVATKKGEEAPKFNENWVGLDWTGLASDGVEPKFKGNSTVSSGLSFQEGSGPFFYDPERYDGEIPQNQTHVQVNLKEDGSLDTKNPLSVLNVAPGVSEETFNGYLSEMIKVLLTTEKKYSDLGKKEDFIYGLTDLMTRSMNEKAIKENKEETESTEKTEDQIIKKNENTNSESLLNDNVHLSDYANENEMTGGAGILPDKIAQDSNQKNKLTDKQIEDMIKKILKQEQSGNNGSGSNGGNSGSSGNSGNGGSSNTDSNSTNGNNWSNTSVSSSGYKLNEEEKKRLEKMIEEYKKELNLNVPKEFVMCIIQRESNFKPEALNDRGEYSVGLMQVNKKSGTDEAALAGLKRYAPNLYEKLKKHHGSDAKIIDTASMQSKNDPQGEKGMTIIALGMAYLKKINAENRRGGALTGPSDWNNLAAGYNCGPAGCKGGNDYSLAVTACTKTMQAKNQQSESKSSGQ